jgi:adenylate cyclase
VVAPGDGRLLEVRAGGIAVPTDARGLAGLAWHGPSSAFPSVSAADVLGSRVAPERLRGKVVLVGPTAPGTWDQRVTPFDEAAPGVLVHATFVENALRGELLDRSPAVLLAELALMVALAAGLAALFARVPPAAALPALLAVAAAWAGAAAWALEARRVALAVGLPVAQALAVFLAVTTSRVLREEREKRRARETFGRFLAPAVVEEVLSREGGLAPGGESRDLTVLFADVRGFTSLSERLDPAALLALLNEVLAPMTEVVVAGHEGTLDKYMGDALMAFWGAPRRQPDHPLRACRAALALAARLAALREGLRARGLPEIDVGIGINTGPMSVGFVGSQDRFYNYTVLGDAVNLASRLEGANREYGTRILLGPETHARVRDEVVARELDLVRVKGRREPVAVHELLGLAPAAAGEAAFLEAWARGRAAFRARRWDEAEARFREADALRGGDPPSRLHLARCEALRRAPPGPAWDGVHELAGK